MSKKMSAAVYTLFHFWVDFTTVFLIIKILLGPEISVLNRGGIIITYNIVAFAGQLPMGIIADAINKNRMVAAAGCVLAAMSYPASLINPWLGCALAAIGNGAFHIGAGTDILEMSMPKAGPSGFFVSSGAFGVWLAYKLSSPLLNYLCPAICLAAFVFLLLTENKNPAEKLCVTGYKFPGFDVALAVACFILTIVIRSFFGMIMDFSWKEIPVFSLLSVVSVVVGKALGGFAGDSFGYVKTAICSLGTALVAFIFSFDFPAAGIIAILFFNMTMPLTLTAIAENCKGKYGFAFGLTTFALAIGFIPTVFTGKEWLCVSVLVQGTAFSLVLLVLGYVILKRRKRNVDFDNSCL